MLEIKNVTKRYETKGVTVTALNNVSVTFPEKGMIFLVGKSGSGKSTLLNISGGLDSPDEGEIILKGKSSKDFSEADFDSYRNTFIGFIFQEFNVLNEYTVEENISLALELQGKPSDKAKVEELLKKVDLAGYGKRKPNTLSGGQKQRVAIARALVKNPEIIMADEPTGALDSATGKQVFDVLQSLSKEKLVVIVSHDRDSAEKYADRIIELKDGNIISDITKNYGGGAGDKKIVSEANTLYISPDEELSEADMECARKFFSAPAANKRVSLKKQSGGREFASTDTANVDLTVYDGNDVKFIKSRLPAKHAVRMGSSGLKIKPVRLVFTVLLSTVAFIIFGLFTTLLTFNKSNVIANEVSGGGYTAAIVDSDVSVTQYSYGYVFGSSTISETSQNCNYRFSADDVEEFNRKNGTNGVGIYTYGKTSDDYYTLKNNLANESQEALSLYYSANTGLRGFCNLQSESLSDYNLKLVAGRYPEGENEIAISVYQYNLLKCGGFMPLTGIGSLDHDSKVELSSYEDVLDRCVSICKYESVNAYFNAKIVGVIDCGEIPSKYEVLKDAKSDNIYWLKMNAVGGYSASEISALYDDFADYYYNSFHGVYFVGDAFYNANIDHFDNSGSTIKAQIAVKIKYALGRGAGSLTDDELIEQYVYTTAEYEALNVSDEDRGIYFVTDYDYENDASDGIYQRIIVPLYGSSSIVATLVAKTEKAEDGIIYSLNYGFLSEANTAQETVDSIMSIFLAAGVGLALFAALMLSNFISASISGKEKDIGILRAIGARGTDIFKIFITEALIITLSCFVLAALASIGVCAIVNGVLVSSGVLNLSLFIFTFPDALMIFAVAVISAVAATIFPVRKAVKKKPVEAIRCL